MSKKILQTAVLLLLLVVFPILSWFFLKGGVDYRMAARGKLDPKALVPEGSPLYERGKIQVLYASDNDGQRERMQPILDNYEDRGDILEFEPLRDDLSGNMLDSLRKTLLVLGKSEELESHAFLIDTAASIVQAYYMVEDAEMARLVEDIALLLPLEEDKDFLFKREREK